jgi:hypothetical protein
MPEQILYQTLEFCDDKGNVVAKLRIYPSSIEPGNLLCLNDAEARQYGEEPLQICEGQRYEYDLETIGGAKLRLVLANDYTNEILVPSRNPKHVNSGQIVPGLRTGRLGLAILNENGEIAGSAGIEIVSKKIGYRADYHQMMEDITEQCVSLLMELRSPTALKLSPEPGKSAETLHQQFAFLRSLLGSRHFSNALHRITTHPHRKWEPEETVCDTRRGFRPDSRSLRQLARGTRRVPLPEGHPLKATVPSIPERISLYRNVQTDDTPENRFVKFALKTFSGFLNKMRHNLEMKGNGADARLCVEIKTLESEIESSLSADIFRGVSDPDMLPLGSPVLQQKEGYREVLQAWLKFDMAARLVWLGGDDVYGAGQRDIATLYEYWVFFKLLDIVSGIFELEKPVVKDLIEETDDGFGLKLKSGKYLPIKGRYDLGSRPLNVQFSYNRTFSFSETHSAKGSWSRNMRPDYTLSLWPADFSEEEAEAQELMVHVHFDAKYRIENITEIFGKEEEDLGEEKVQQREGRYKRADLLKMHAYRDAIRRTQGAYVLYPGTISKQWNGYHEILPGLGAFPIRPGNGDEDLEQFIRTVVAHLCDRATSQERQSYHTYAVHEAQVAYPVMNALPERKSESVIRHSPLAETFVLVGWCKDDAHNNWIRKSGLYNCRMDTNAGSLRLDPEITGAKYLLLHGKEGKAASGLLRIKSQGPRVISKDALKNKGYPGEPGHDFYLIFDVEPADEFDGYAWDYSKLSHKSEGRLSGWPYAVTLLALMAIVKTSERIK